MKLGLSLSGGGIKGVSHIGAIKALEEARSLIIFQGLLQEVLLQHYMLADITQMKFMKYLKNMLNLLNMLI